VLVWRGPSRGFFQAPHKDRHFLLGLAVAFLSRRLDPAPISFQRFRVASRVVQGASERFPRRRVVRVAFHGVAKILRGARRVLGLLVFEAQRKAQQRAVAWRAEELL